MPISRQWKDAYVCLYCCLRSNKRSFSSSLKYHNSTTTNNELKGSSAFETPFFQSPLFPPPPPSSATPNNDDNDSESPSDRKTNKSGETGTAEPPPESDGTKDVKIIRVPRLIGSQLQSIATLSKVTKKLSKATKTDASIENAVKQVLLHTKDLSEKKFIDILAKVYSGQTIQDVTRDLSVLKKLNKKSRVDTPTEELVARLTRHRLLKAPLRSLWGARAAQENSSSTLAEKEHKLTSASLTTPAKRNINKVAVRGVRTLRGESKIRRVNSILASAVQVPADESTDKTSAATKKEYQFTSVIAADALNISLLPRIGPAVPNLCHDLSRVLFNPGIYQLQDPRSRVFNFDPYLEKIMPVSEFDFELLKEYITSSRDENLRSLALEHGKKYVGSSSSMTSTLGQFHFLLSQWRDINTEAVSRGFSETLKSFTIIQRSPSAVFLRYRDGVYAMDADKEFDNSNILMSLGKSMEKMLTQEPRSYERYRKSSEAEIPEDERNAPEAYQYSVAGDFLMRAQLDAHDPRLPGTGTFDLKTRAVASIRHNINQHEDGFGYQIKSRFGDWESYEREYFDMIRSAFLKYSLQVRMGQMDGIFVAFHNVERIFGFQYICLPEMDLALHGQYDTILGDQEFKFSVELLNQVINRATERFPKRSLRLQFETRDLAAAGVYMQIFAEPMDETNIDAIQNSRTEAIEAFERRLMAGESCSQTQDTDELDAVYEASKIRSEGDSASGNHSTSQESTSPDAQVDESSLNVDLSHANSPFGTVDQMTDNGTPSPAKSCGDSHKAGTAEAPVNADSSNELLALKLRIRNRVNNDAVTRPKHLTSSDRWSVEYSLEEEKQDSAAQSQYRASKARRKTVLDQKGAETSAANYYLRKLREMAIRGAEWRKAQDELDAGRKRVVLYED